MGFGGASGPGFIDGLFRLFIGLILILAGLYAILFWWGYSTMIDPSLPDTEWWAEWRGKAFAGELLIALTLGIGLVCYGCWLLGCGMGEMGDPEISIDISSPDLISAI